MGPGRQYPLVADDRQSFVTAAVGYSYSYLKFRHFFHQPDCLNRDSERIPRRLPRGGFKNSKKQASNSK